MHQNSVEEEDLPQSFRVSGHANKSAWGLAPISAMRAADCFDFDGSEQKGADSAKASEVSLAFGFE